MLTRGRPAIVPAVLLSLAVACGPGGQQSSVPASSPTPSAAASAVATNPASPSASASTATSGSPLAGTFSNPVIDADFADPFVTNIDGTYYAYATGSAGKSIQFATSPDLVTWSTPAEALSRQPRWMAGATWAPEVFATREGYVMYYSGRSATPRPDHDGAQCISRAVADTPEGPFLDDTDEPLVCQPELGGSIDPTRFTAEGKNYLVWKNEGNCCGIPTQFWLQELSEDGLSLVGAAPTDLGVQDDAAWEGGVIEAPTLLERDGTIYLFYSANSYESHRYAVGYATSETVTGPFTDGATNPILATQRPATAVGPGHQSIVADDEGDLWVAYHAWDVSGIGYDLGGRRAMWIDELVFDAGVPSIQGPDADPQPVP